MVRIAAAALFLLVAATASAGPSTEAPLIFASDRALNYPWGDIFVVDRTGKRINVTATPNVWESQPSWAPDGVRLVMTRNEGPLTSIDLYVLDTRTRAISRFTDAPGQEEQAAWSPDGTRVAFTRTNRGVNDLVVKTVASGAELRLVTDGNPVNLTSPTWSPDSGSLAYTGNDGVHVVAPDGTGGRLLIPRQNMTPKIVAWLPRGLVLAREVADDGFALDVVSADGTRRSIADPCGNAIPEWSVTGTEVVCPKNLYQLSPVAFLDAAGHRRGVAVLQPRGRAPTFDGATLRDGRYAFSARLEARDADLWVAGENAQGPKPLLAGPQHDHDPAWSRDGRRVVFVRHGSFPSGIGVDRGRLFMLDLKTHHLRALGLIGASPDVDPGSGRIAFTTLDGVYVYDPATRRARKAAKRATSPAWRPGTHTLAAVSGLTVRTLGPRGRVLFRAREVNDLAWSPDGMALAFASRTVLGVWRAKTGARILVRDSNNPFSSPTWSHDGSTILYASGWAAFDRPPDWQSPDAHAQQLSSVPSAGGTPQRLTNGFASGDFDPALRP